MGDELRKEKAGSIPGLKPEIYGARTRYNNLHVLFCFSNCRSVQGANDRNGVVRLSSQSILFMKLGIAVDRAFATFCLTQARARVGWLTTADAAYQK